LPEQVVPQFFGVGTHGRQCGELAGEDHVGMGSLVIFERTPIRDDDIMVVSGLGFCQGSLVRDEARELECLPGDESALGAPVRFLDDTA
jgi:hypothetical protein